MEEHTLLVAFTVNGEDRQDAMRKLACTIPSPDQHAVTSWWIAEDDRNDGSDCDSAVFVYPGKQHKASMVLFAADLTEKHNMIMPHINQEFRDV